MTILRCAPLHARVRMPVSVWGICAIVSFLTTNNHHHQTQITTTHPPCATPQINLQLLRENQGDVGRVLRLLQGEDLNASESGLGPPASGGGLGGNGQGQVPGGDGQNQNWV